MLNIVSVRLETVLALVQDRCTARKSFWPHPMELPGDVGRVECRYGLFGNGVSVGVR
jgi:hypothetical protein